MQSDTVECKPTMWFTGRAVIMALMFLGFGVYFYYDASTGYPQKNLEFFMHKAFVDAGALFDREVSGNGPPRRTGSAPFWSARLNSRKSTRSRPAWTGTRRRGLTFWRITG